MKAIYLEDCRRVFILTMKLIYRNNKADRPTYSLRRRQERGYFKDNHDDAIVIPVRIFKAALKLVVEQLGLHEEQAKGYIEAFGKLEWILRPKTREGKYRTELYDKSSFAGKSLSVYIIDRIKLDYLEELNGFLVKNERDDLVKVRLRTPDGRIATVNGVEAQTTLTTGVVQNFRYDKINEALDKSIMVKDAVS